MVPYFTLKNHMHLLFEETARILIDLSMLMCIAFKSRPKGFTAYKNQMNQVKLDIYIF
jgi:hypothetical protein